LRQFFHSNRAAVYQSECLFWRREGAMSRR
jgi:hypothetical protein